MTITIDAGTFALILVGLLSGTAAALLVDRSARSGQKLLRNVIIGVAGALVGEILFDALDLTDDIPEFFTATITVADILVAFLGALLLMFTWQRFS